LSSVEDLFLDIRLDLYLRLTAGACVYQEIAIIFYSDQIGLERFGDF
jgi:hypothetical protein